MTIMLMDMQVSPFRPEQILILGPVVKKAGLERAGGCGIYSLETLRISGPEQKGRHFASSTYTLCVVWLKLVLFSNVLKR